MNGYNRKTGIWAITPGGGNLGLKLLKKSYFEADFYIPEWLGNTNDFKLKSKHVFDDDVNESKNILLFKSLAGKIEEKFTDYEGHVFIFSTGIAVRIIAPLLLSKLKDPAVVVMDDRACHVISLVSGHIGNANTLAVKIAELTGADPVITTATDINGLPAIDVIAGRKRLFIENPNMIKNINMAFIKNTPINIIDPYNLITPYIPVNLLIDAGRNSKDLVENFVNVDIAGVFYSVLCSDRIVPVSRETLVLRPRTLVVGIGCNRNTSFEEINNFIKTAFYDLHLSVKSIELIASSDIKQDEKGLLEFAEQMNFKIKFYGKKQLNSVKNIKNPSDMVEKHIGVKSVCEAAAILASNNGELIVPKKKKGNVTLAVARKPRHCL